MVGEIKLFGKVREKSEELNIFWRGQRFFQVISIKVKLKYGTFSKRKRMITYLF